MRIAPHCETRERSHFDFLHPDERCLLFFRKHGLFLLFRLGRIWIPATVLFIIILWVGMAVDPEGFFWFLSTDAFHIVMIMYGIVLLHSFFIMLINYFLGYMMVTNKRVIEVHKTVFIREEMTEVPYDTMVSIHHEKKGILQNLLQFGTIHIESNVYQHMKMGFVPHAEKKALKISKIHGEYINIPEGVNRWEEEL